MNTPDDIADKINLLDLSDINMQLNDDTSTHSQPAVVWHVFTMDFNPANITSRITWSTKSIRIHDGKTYCYYTLKHHTDFQVKTPISDILKWQTSSTDNSDEMDENYMNIALIRDYFTSSNFMPDHFVIDGILAPSDSYVILPVNKIGDDIHVAILNFDYTYNNQIDLQYPNIKKYNYSIDMMDGIKMHRNISTGSAFGSTLNLFDALTASIKKRQLILPVGHMDANNPINMQQFIFIATPYFPELQVIWESSSIALTPGIDTAYFRESAYQNTEEPAHNRRNALVMRRLPDRIIRREAAFTKLFTSTNTQPGTAPLAKNFGKMMFCLKSHANQQQQAAAKGQKNQYSHLNSQFDNMIVD